MTLLEAISPTARTLLAITKGERRKVHAPTEDHKPLCGGGYGGKSVHAWQEDIGEVSCEACRNIIQQRKNKTITTEKI